MAPHRRSARRLAERFEVSTRTIERDIGALQQAGVPIYADTGRRGGYTLDRAMTLPPLNFTPEEAVAVAVALGRLAGGPFTRAGQSALRKVVAAMPERDVAAARDLAARVRLVEPAEASEAPALPLVVERAIVNRRVVRIDYEDRQGVRTGREIEPYALVTAPRGWYLTAWCRLRGAERVFRMDRIVAATPTGLAMPERPGTGTRLEPQGFRVRTADGILQETPT